MAMLLLISSLVAAHLASGFEVPFPKDGAQIQSMIETGQTAIGAPAPGAAQSARRRLVLGSGTRAEVVSYSPPPAGPLERAVASFLGDGGRPGRTPVLVFVHGSFHSSWCWEEKYLPHFAGLGYPCVALSLQGTGGTPAVEVGARRVKIASHVADLDALVRGLSDDDDHSLGLNLGRSPQIVLLGHSFGGLTIMKWLEKYYQNERASCALAGVCLLCSVPPSGNGNMTLRFLRRSLKQSWQITAGFVLKRAITNEANCRALFFGGDADDNGVTAEDVARFQSYFARDSAATIDLADLTKHLPSNKVDDAGRAPFADALPPSLVVAAADDFIVDGEGSEETARYFGLDSPVVVDSPHDVMLGDRWKNGANAILEWLKK